LGGIAAWLSSARAGRLALALALAAVIAAAGCPTTEDDDDLTGDDDTGDDDTVDIPFLRYEFGMDVAGDSAAVHLWVDVLDEDRQLLCTYPIELTADVGVGGAAGGVFWDGLDERFTLVDAWDPETTDCGPEYGKPYHDGPLDVIENWTPLGFASCDVVGEDPAFLGDDPTGVGDGSFASYCQDTAPAVADAREDLALGPVEAIWFGRSVEGVLDGYGDYEYMPSADGEWHWYVMGLLYAEGDHPTEPAPGLDGTYRAVALWLFVPF